MQKTTKYKLTVKEQREIALSLIHRIKPSYLQLHELSTDTIIKFYGMYKLINIWQMKIAIRNGIPLRSLSTIKTRNDIPWFNETVTALIKEAKELNSVKEENVVKDTPPVYKPVTTTLSQKDVDRISDAVVSKILPKLLEAINGSKPGTKVYGPVDSVHTHNAGNKMVVADNALEVLSNLTNPIPIPDPVVRSPSKPAIKTRLPRILIYGLFKPQQEIVDKNWKDKFDLRFIDFKNNSINKMELDYCIGMTKFMNHSVDGSLKKLYGDRYIRVTGAVSELQKRLNDLNSILKAH